jgi:hypothetical protein
MSDDVEELNQLLNEQLSVKDKEGRVVLQVAQIVTVYVEEAYRQEVREGIASCCEGYFRRFGQHLRWTLNTEERRMDRFGEGKRSRPGAWLPALGEDESFYLLCHGGEDERAASPFFVEVSGVERRPHLELGYLRMSLPLLRLADGALPALVLDLCRTLKPVSGYGGIGVVESASSILLHRYESMVYAWAQRFPGLEVDSPQIHVNWLLKGREGDRDGIKGGNWLTALGDRYVAELGGADSIEADLEALDDRFLVHRYEGGIMIQAGPRPELGDAERDLWPALYVKLAKYLKPIRVTRHKAFSYGAAGVRFDRESSEAWLRRFDDR